MIRDRDVTAPSSSATSRRSSSHQRPRPLSRSSCGRWPRRCSSRSTSRRFRACSTGLSRCRTHSRRPHSLAPEHSPDSRVRGRKPTGSPPMPRRSRFLRSKSPMSCRCPMKDSTGAGLAIAGLPLTIGGIIGGVLTCMLVHSRRMRAVAVVVYGAVGGLALTLILQSWFGILQGSFGLNVLAAGLAVASTAALINGFVSLIGTTGIAVGAILTMFIGNPISSLQQPKEFLVAPGRYRAVLRTGCGGHASARSLLFPRLAHGDAVVGAPRMVRPRHRPHHRRPSPRACEEAQRSWDYPRGQRQRGLSSRQEVARR